MSAETNAGHRLMPRRLPRISAFSLLELALLALLAVQSARLVYALVTPLHPLGAWQASSGRGFAPVMAADLGSFDPFFRLAPETGPAVVTSLDLELFGVREDRATGRGSAIIGTSDGAQQSFTIGDEIMPGVTLTEVGFESVTIMRGAVAEQIFLVQSGTADESARPPEPAPVPGGRVQNGMNP